MVVVRGFTNVGWVHRGGLGDQVAEVEEVKEQILRSIKLTVIDVRSALVVACIPITNTRTTPSRMYIN